MKLYVWDDVLTDATHGLMFAAAESIEQARELLAKDGGEDVLHDMWEDPTVYDLTSPVTRIMRGGE